jgi:hypothetical protein
MSLSKTMALVLLLSFWIGETKSSYDLINTPKGDIIWR